LSTNPGAGIGGGLLRRRGFGLGRWPAFSSPSRPNEAVTVRRYLAAHGERHSPQERGAQGHQATPEVGLDHRVVWEPIGASVGHCLLSGT